MTVLHGRTLLAAHWPYALQLLFGDVFVWHAGQAHQGTRPSGGPSRSKAGTRAAAALGLVHQKEGRLADGEHLAELGGRDMALK